MYTLFEIPSDVSSSFSGLRDSLAGILAPVTPHNPDTLLIATNDLYGDPERTGLVYVLTEGVMSYRIAGANYLHFEEGDLVGLEAALGFVDGKYNSEFAVKAREYRLADIYATCLSPIRLNLWTRFLAHWLHTMTKLVGALRQGEQEFHPDVRAYKKGDLIIEQGIPAKHVFTLIEGTAEVFVDEVKVGEVTQDEIFGALAALTGMPRTASVRAGGDCLALVLEASKFKELIAHRPSTVLKMVGDMARTIVNLNQKVVALAPQGDRTREAFVGK